MGNEVKAQPKTEPQNSEVLVNSKKKINTSWFLIVLYLSMVFASALSIVVTLAHFKSLIIPDNVKHYQEYQKELEAVFAVISPGINGDGLLISNQTVPDFIYLEEKEYRNLLLCNNYSALGDKIKLYRPDFIILGEHDLDDKALDSYLKASGYQMMDYIWDNFRVFRNSEDTEGNTYYIDIRDCIVFGETAEELCHQFPYCIYETNIPFKDYPIELLLDKKVIIYLEEKYENTYVAKVIEEKILELERNGVRVVIEPAYEARIRLFDVRMQYVDSETPLTVFCTDLTPYEFQRIIILQSQKEKIGGFYGTNTKEMKSLLEMQNGLDGTIYPIIATLNVDGIDLTFIGNKLSEYVLPVYVRGFGADGINYSNAIQNSRKISNLFEDLMTYFEVKKEGYLVSNLAEEGNIDGSKDNNVYRVILDKKYDKHYSAIADGEEVEIINQEGMCTVLVSDPYAKIEVEWEFIISDYLYMLVEVASFAVFVALTVERKRTLRGLCDSHALLQSYFEQPSDSNNENAE